MYTSSQVPHLRWRFYRSAMGRQPVKEFLNRLSDYDHTALTAEMRLVQREGLAAARHIAGDLYEVRASGLDADYRIIFSLEGKRILLALDAYQKGGQKLPVAIRRRSERRLSDWRKSDPPGTPVEKRRRW